MAEQRNEIKNPRSEHKRKLLWIYEQWERIDTYVRILCLFIHFILIHVTPVVVAWLSLSLSRSPFSSVFFLSRNGRKRKTRKWTVQLKMECRSRINIFNEAADKWNVFFPRERKRKSFSLFSSCSMEIWKLIVDMVEWERNEYRDREKSRSKTDECTSMLFDVKSRYFHTPANGKIPSQMAEESQREREKNI